MLFEIFRSQNSSSHIGRLGTGTMGLHMFNIFKNELTCEQLVLTMGIILIVRYYASFHLATFV